MSLARISGAATSSGVVYDNATKQPIPDVTMELLATTGPTGTYYTTDGNGSFVSPTFGVYGLKFTHAEYAPVEYAAASVAQNMAVYMNRKDGTLPGVTITASAAKKKQLLTWLAIIGIGYYGYKQKWF